MGLLCYCYLLYFFPNQPGGQTPQPIFTQNGLNNVNPRKDVPFGVKIKTFLNPWPPEPQNRKNLAHFGWDLENFRSILPLTLAVSRANTPYFSPEPHKSCIVNRQIGVGDSKYVVIFDPLQPGHVTQAHSACAMCYGRLHRENAGLDWHMSDRTFTSKYLGNCSS